MASRGQGKEERTRVQNQGITLSTRPLQSLPCPRMSSTTMVKGGAHLVSARQTWQMNSQGEHANEPCELQGSCPSGTASLRQRVALI